MLTGRSQLLVWWNVISVCAFEPSGFDVWRQMMLISVIMIAFIACLKLVYLICVRINANSQHCLERLNMIYKNIWVLTNVTEAALRWIAVEERSWFLWFRLCLIDCRQGAKINQTQSLFRRGCGIIWGTPHNHHPHVRLYGTCRVSY